MIRYDICTPKLSLLQGKGYTAGTKQLLSQVSGATKRLQKSLHTLLKNASNEELNYILCAVNVPATIEVVGKSTIEFLIKEKVRHLETVSRAALVDGIQKLGLRYRPTRQSWVRDVILHTRGFELTKFKGYIDDGGDYHTMYKLIYNDLQGTIQREVLDHIRKEGLDVMNALGDLGSDRPPAAVLKVLSDIDDTVFSSGGSFPAGVDMRYPRKCFYPGALAFYSALDRCFAQKYAATVAKLVNGSVKVAASSKICSEATVASAPDVALQDHQPIEALQQASAAFHYTSIGSFGEGDGKYVLSTIKNLVQCPIGPPRHHQEGSNLIFLSARPESYKGLTESESYRKYFQPFVLRGDLDTSPTMLLGSLDSGPRALMKLLTNKWVQSDDPNPKTAADVLYQTIAAKKLSRFREYAAIYPEAAFVFVGDNGQGDALCAEILSSDSQNSPTSVESPKLIASFIHKVIPTTQTLSILARSDHYSREDLLSAWEERNIYFERTHVGMAVDATNIGLLDKEGLEMVTRSAVSDFARIMARYQGRRAGRNLAEAAKRLNEDLSSASCLLGLDFKVSLIECQTATRAVVELSDKLDSCDLSDVNGLTPMH
jgi:hypothetical protein